MNEERPNSTELGRSCIDNKMSDTSSRIENDDEWFLKNASHAGAMPL